MCVAEYNTAGVQPSRFWVHLFTVISLVAGGCWATVEWPEIPLPHSLSAIPSPPAAERRPHELVMHEDVRQDPYYWLRDDDREDPDVLAYLNAENDYLKAVMSDTEALQEELFTEMRGRIQEADQTAPLRRGGYFYYTRTVEGKQYSVHCRRKLPEGMGPPSELDVMDESLPEEILLDENAEAKNHSFCKVSGFDISPDDNLMIYSVDTSGSELYTVHLKEISTGREILKEPIKGTSGQMVFAMDNETIFYVTKNEVRRRNKVWKHKIGTLPAADECIYHEKDEAYYVYIGMPRDQKVIFIYLESEISTEIRYVDAEDPDSEWKVLYERQHDVDYFTAHRDGHFYTVIRDSERPNSELVVAPATDLGNQKVLIPHREDVLIEDIIPSKNFLAVFERKNGLQGVTLYGLPRDGSLPKSLGEGQELQFSDPTHGVSAGLQGDFHSDVLRLAYTSLTRPSSVVDCNMATGRSSVKKMSAVLGDFDVQNYKSERIWATAKDATKVPISIVYKKDAVKLDGSDPLLLYAYGAYGRNIDPAFSSKRLSLLDRGFVYAIAHVRGGGQMGRYWYEDGKLLKKKNTFRDVIACAEELIERKYCSPETLCLEGRSAGGLTVSATINMRPDLFKAAILGVPFVDVLTTMLDPTIPLTVIEWEEWGDPRIEEYYYYMKSYSPVDNIEAKDYPNILVTAGLHDPRVGYWEPAKYIAKLRSLKSDSNLLIMKCNMEAGHFAMSGRFDYLKEEAMEYAFLLKSLGMIVSET